ncbi:MAG: EscU/YscU/HrcU family type III secretion system export apparatus switch protein [Comamonadaceae bacterium]|nr:EscU/YscU/HrcU family type III secretion system export apparatus switch protein [Comamonadaceae bacterium]
MTRQEVRDEMKDTEGKPEVKRHRIRRLQQEFAQRRMMEKVPTADVIITNPTSLRRGAAVPAGHACEHLSSSPRVSNGWRCASASWPTEHRSTTVSESPLLARALYFNGAFDNTDSVPALYLAVAQVLAYVYQLAPGRATRR